MSNYSVTVTYKNTANEYDKKIEKWLSKTLSDWKCDFLECTRILIFKFSSPIAANRVEGILTKKMPKGTLVSVVVKEL